MVTWFVPGGEFTREQIQLDTGSREVIKNNSFHFVESHPQTWQIFSALFNGFVDKAEIIIFILMVGGAFWILNSTKSIEVGIKTFLKYTDKFKTNKLINVIGVDNLIFVSVILVFSIFGAIFGMSEETIAFVIVFVPLAISMGYDSIVGISLCYVSAHIGFSGAILNPFTIGIAQGIAELPIFSGIEYRLFCWIILTGISVFIILFYAKKIKKNPEKSPMYHLDKYWRDKTNQDKTQEEKYYITKSAKIVCFFLIVVMGYCAYAYPTSKFIIGELTFSFPIFLVLAVLFTLTSLFLLKKTVHFFILNLLFFTILYLVVGVLAYDWYVMEISALFLALGVFAGISANKGADDIVKLFLEGAKDIISAALVVGLASGIIIILKDGRVLDTILFGLTKYLSHLGEVTSVAAMYVFQTGLNLVMPSGSAKAALTMPIMAQFSDLMHVSRQTTVLAFQFGDGFTNMITPTSGVLVACLAIARIPYTIWVKWVWKIILFFIVVGFMLILPTLFIELPGF